MIKKSPILDWNNINFIQKLDDRFVLWSDGYYQEVLINDAENLVTLSKWLSKKAQEYNTLSANLAWIASELIGDQLK